MAPASPPAPLRAGDVVRVNFGTPRGFKAGFARAADIITATELAQIRQLLADQLDIPDTAAREIPP